MPKFEDDTKLEQYKVGNFGFTAQSPDELESSGYTLVDIAIDTSGSTASFEKQMEDALINAIYDLKGDPSKNIKPHPKADSIMLRITTFSTSVREVMGYTPLMNVDPETFRSTLHSSGSTALFDSVIATAEAAYNYGKLLTSEDYEVNGIVFIITDGANNSGKFYSSRSGQSYYPDKSVYQDHLKAVKEALKKPLKQEAMESYLSILIGVNCGAEKEVLLDFHKEAGFTQDFLALEDATPGTISKIGKFISESVSSQSQARGTGGASQSIATRI
jgi:hypothetical protein